MAAACTSDAASPASSTGATSPIGSFEVDDTALVWGGRSIEETISVLRDVTGPTSDVDATVGVVGPIVSLPKLPEASVEGTEVFVTCTTPVFETCAELNVRTTAWLSASLTATELEAVFLSSTSFPTLEEDLVSGGLLEPTFTSTPEGDLVEIHAEPDGAVGQFKVRQLVESVHDQVDLEATGDLIAPLLSSESELRSVLFNIRDGVPTIDIEFVTAADSEEAARQRTVDALLANSWTEQAAGMFVRESGDESFTAQLTQTRFREQMLEERLTITAGLK